MSWTQEETALATRLWDRGLSASQIADALGAGFTRNAVLGKLHRLKLGKKAGTVTRPGPERPAAISAAPPRRASRSLPRPKKRFKATDPAPKPQPVPALGQTPDAERAAPRPDTLVSSPDPVTLLERTARQCAWVLGVSNGAETLRCGNPVEPGGSWCSGHAGTVWGRLP